MVLIAEIFSQDYRSNPQRGFSLAFVARSSQLWSGNHARSLLEPRFREIPFLSQLEI